jgi:hypothetical protein
MAPGSNSVGLETVSFLMPKPLELIVATYFLLVAFHASELGVKVIGKVLSKDASPSYAILLVSLILTALLIHLVAPSGVVQISEALLVSFSLKRAFTSS